MAADRRNRPRTATYPRRKTTKFSLRHKKRGRRNRAHLLLQSRPNIITTKCDDLMTEYQAGSDALDALNSTGESGNNTEFSSFKSGSTYYIKVLGTADLISFFSYGIYKQSNSFVAK